MFDPIFAVLMGKAGESDRLMIDAACLKVRKAASYFKKEALPHRIGRPSCGLNSKLRAGCDGQGATLVS